VFLIFVALGLFGCAGTQQSVVPEPEEPAFRDRDIFFMYPLNITTPEKDPVTTQEFVNTGLFFFQEGAYADAAVNFDRAADGIFDERHPFRRLCLMSAAVCRLLLDDKAAFVDTVEQLRRTYTSYQLVILPKTSPQAQALLDMCDKIKTANGL